MNYYVGGDSDLALKKIYIDVSKLTEGNQSKISNIFLKMDPFEALDVKSISPLSVLINTQQTEEELMKGKPAKSRRVFEENSERKQEEEQLFKYLLLSFKDI
jgi:hypothetical protein